MKKSTLFPAFSVSLFMSLGLSACGKSVLIGTPDASSGAPLNPVPTDVPLESCVPQQWEFTQPLPTQKSRAVDLLFVVDTSSSLSAERSGLADALPAFISQLPPGADLRIGVMPAHGGASTLSGKLYAATGTPLVLDSKKLSPAEMQSSLRKTLSQAPGDRDEANGEALLYSLKKSFEPSRAAWMRERGFYRPEAALSIVLVNDENDVCFSPRAHGYAAFPDFVASAGNWEDIALERYCAGITPETVLEAARDFKADQNLSWAAITHVDPLAVPRGPKSEDAIGHGTIELTQLALDGLRMDLSQISTSDLSHGLGQLGSVVATQGERQLSFSVPSSTPLDARTIRVSVDGAPVESNYDPQRQRVEIRAAQAGSPGSLVRITACGTLSLR